MATIDTFMNTIKSDFIQNNTSGKDTSKIDKSDSGFSNVLDSVNKSLNFSYDKSSSNTLAQTTTKDVVAQASTGSFVQKTSFVKENASSDKTTKTSNKTTKKTSSDKKEAKDATDKTKSTDKTDTDDKKVSKIDNNDDKAKKDSSDKQDTTAGSTSDITSDTTSDSSKSSDVPQDQIENITDNTLMLKDLLNSIPVTDAATAAVTTAATTDSASTDKSADKNTAIASGVASKQTQDVVGIQNGKISLNSDPKNLLDRSQVEEKIANSTNPTDVKTLDTEAATPTTTAADTKENKGIEFQVQSDVAVKDSSLTKGAKTDFSEKTTKAAAKLDNIETSDKPIITKVEVAADSQQQNTDSNSSDLFKDQTLNINNFASLNSSNVTQTTQGTESFSNTLNNAQSKTLSPMTERSILDQVSNQAVDGLKDTGTSKISMVLNPESLGKITLEIVNSAKDGLSAQFVAENSQVKEALTKNIDNLKQNLQDQGINVNSLVVKVQETQTSNNSQFDFQQQQNQAGFKFGQYDQNTNNNGQNNQNNGQGQSQANSNGFNGAVTEESSKTDASTTGSYVHSGRVDYTI